jgi:cytochrome bd ubiquinol oxidase subunit II
VSLAEVFLAVIWLGVTGYVLFAGADFGAGFWDLLAGDTQRGMPQRKLIEHTIAPVWEANHVWLIFVIVMMWTGFPEVFASIASTTYIPLTLAAFGIIGRGAAFAFRKASDDLRHQRLYGAIFAISSSLTPFFLGAVAGGIASGRVPLGIDAGDNLTSWLNPTSIATGALAVGVSAYLAACYLVYDAKRHAPDLVGAFRTRAIASGVLVGGLAIVALFVVRDDAPAFWDEMTTGWGLAFVIASAVLGLASLGLLALGRYLLVRITAAGTVAAVLWGWGAGQHPDILPGVGIDSAAAAPVVLRTTLIALAIGAVALIPSLTWLYLLFQRERDAEAGSGA